MMSSESLMSNVQPNSDADAQYKDYQDLSPESSSKRKTIIFIISAIASVIIIVATILICYFFFFKQKDDNTNNGFEFVYINDIHLDPLYVTDSSPTNCRMSSGSGINHTFGQYGCDSPASVFISMIDFLPKASTNPKFVLFGGDSVAHSLNYDMDQVREVIGWIIQNITNIYPNIPILFSLGNNDFVPNYGYDNFSGDTENFESVSKVLAPFMNEDQQSTFKKGGYYYQDFPDMNLRLIIVNSIIYNTDREIREDPYDQFKWIRKVSKEGKDKGYKIGVSIHIPPGVSYNSGSNLNQGWREEYMKEFDQVVKEFDIQFVLSAHSHYDMIMPLYMPNGVSNTFSLSAPSISPQHHNNPAFRVVKISDGNINDYVQYYADIMMNPQSELDWKVEYRFNEAYSVSGVGKEDLTNIVNWIKTTGEGRWRYMEKICSLASDNGKFYYCVLTCTTDEEIQKCMKPLNSNVLDFSQYFPYGGER